MIIGKAKLGLLLIFLLLVFQAETQAQERHDSLAFKHFKDSVMAVRMAESIKLQREEDSLTLLKRVVALKSLQNCDADTVRRIVLPHLLIDQMPDLKLFINATSVDLYHNELSEISLDIWPESDSLKAINLESNHLREVRFKKNKSVETLNLSHNDFNKIPRSIKKLKALKTLDISYNSITSIPCFIKRMDSLKELKMNYNQLHQLKRKHIRRLKHLESIHLGANDLYELPKNMNLLKNVITLNLGRNHLSTLPASFIALDSLQHLIFYRNEFDSIPALVFQLKALKELDFYYNQINEIPDAVGNLRELERLFLSYNHIDRIPDSVFSLTHLKALYIHHNNIIVIPDKIIDLSHLMYLDLGFNRIMDIPDLSEMTDLKEVDFQGNNLTEFPYTLLENKHLTHIFLMGNTFVMTDEERAEMQKLSDELLELGIKFYF